MARKVKKQKKRELKFKDNPKPPYADPHGAHFDRPLKFYPSDQYVNNYDLIDWNDDKKKD